MEWTLGNPDIRPNREQEHTFQVSYTHPRPLPVFPSSLRQALRSAEYGDLYPDS